MIIGIGIDTAEIPRIARAAEKSGFCERFFTEEENKLFADRRNSAQTIAANFAAKEAFSKALGTGIRGFALRDIEVLRNESGKPYINLRNGLADFEHTVHVSLTHTKEYASAVVIIEERER